MHFDDCVRVVEEAFGLYGEGKTLKPGMAKDYVSPGTFIAAMGANSPDKQELRALESNKVVADVLEQCARRRALPRARKRHARRRRVR